MSVGKKMEKEYEQVRTKNWVYANGGADKIMMYRGDERCIHFLALQLAFVLWTQISKKRCKLWNRVLSCKWCKKKLTNSVKKTPFFLKAKPVPADAVEPAQIYDDKFMTKWITVGNDWIRLEKWEKCIPWVVSLLFSWMPGNRTVLTAIKGGQNNRGFCYVFCN